MPMNNIRLPQSSWGTRIGYAREELWLFDTHLLCVRGIFGMEFYQRFYYRDIESISVCRTERRTLMVVLLLLAIALLSVLFALSEAPMYVWVIFLSPLGIVLLLNARDATCRVELRTRVNTRRLSSLGHVWVACRALEMLRGRIEEAQGGEGEELRVESGELRVGGGDGSDGSDVVVSVGDAWEESGVEPPHSKSGGEAQHSSAATLVPPPLPVVRGVDRGWFYWTFALMVVGLVVDVMGVNEPSAFVLVILSIAIGLACTFTAVMMCIAMRGRAVAPSLKAAGISVLVYRVIMSALAMFALMIILAAAQESEGQKSLAAVYEGMVEEAGAFSTTFALVCVVIHGFLTAWLGMMLLRRRLSRE